MNFLKFISGITRATTTSWTHSNVLLTAYCLVSSCIIFKRKELLDASRSRLQIFFPRKVEHFRPRGIAECKLVEGVTRQRSVLRINPGTSLVYIFQTRLAMLRRNSVKDFNTIVTLDFYKLRIGNCELSQNEIVVKSKEVNCVVWYKNQRRGD